MKKEVIIVSGIKCFTTVTTLGWNTARVSIYIPHRRGQLVTFDITAGKYNCYEIFECGDYTIVEFNINRQYFYSAYNAANVCASYITNLSKFVNFEANDSLVTKELLNIFK